MRLRILFALIALLLTACAPLSATDPTPTAPVDTPGATPRPIATDLAISRPSVQAELAASPSLTQEAEPTLEPVPAPTEAALTVEGNEIAALDAAERAPRNQVALARALGSCRAEPAACPDVARTTPLDVQVGDVRKFWVIDHSNDSQYQIDAVLRYAGPVVLMYVEQDLPYNQEALEKAARAFEQEIYPRDREIFGSEVQPGVDGDNRITILNAREKSQSVLGYFSSQDSLPAQVNRYSNEREMFFMNAELLDFANPAYLDVLAHEFQHMIHQNQNQVSALWFNEGLSVLAEDLNGFVDHGFALLYLYSPDVPLIAWSETPGERGAHYGAANLFLRYIYAQYAGEDQLRPLVQADAGNHLNAFVDLARQKHPELTGFGQIVADWAVANLIDNPRVADGRYTYATGHDLPDLLPEHVTPEPIGSGSRVSDVSQFGVDYLALPVGSTSLQFRGQTTVKLTGEMPRGRYAWWSNRSDDTVATLTRALDLQGLKRATLHFDTWFEIEPSYDYAFVTVSTDGGRTWETLSGNHTTTDDPQGANYGYGMTGISGAPGSELGDGARGVWVNEQMDLTPYVGQEVLLRFWQINDQGFNAPGMYIDNISIPELGFSDDAEQGDGDWQAEGFLRVDGDLPQQWELRLVRTAADGTITVDPVALDAEGRADVTLNADEQGVLVVVATTPHTTERAGYEVVIE